MTRSRAEHAPAGDGGAPGSGSVRLAHAAWCVVEEPAHDRALGSRERSLDDRQVRPLDGVRRELRLQRSLRPG